MKMRMKGKRGFTLIELLVVIVIIGILGGTALVGFSNFFTRAEQKNANEMCKQIADAWTRYYSDLGFWPSAVDSASTQEMDTDMCAILGQAKLLDVNYIISGEEADTASGLTRNRDDDPQLKFGLLDPTGLERFNRGERGADLKEHLYQFVLDHDGDGRITLPGEIGGGEIQATAAVWCWPEDDAARQDGDVFGKSW